MKIATALPTINNPPIIEATTIIAMFSVPPFD
jgi:hypothetical protein